MADITTLNARLAAAEEAYHRFMVGDRESEVRFADGRAVRLSETNADALRSYVNELRAQLAAASSPMARGPIGFMF